MRNKLTDLLHHRRLKQMELALERDATACECLRQHIKQLDADISKAVTAEADELEETTQVIPVQSMAELVYGDKA